MVENIDTIERADDESNRISVLRYLTKQDLIPELASLVTFIFHNLPIEQRDKTLTRLMDDFLSDREGVTSQALQGFSIRVKAEIARNEYEDFLQSKHIIMPFSYPKIKMLGKNFMLSLNLEYVSLQFMPLIESWGQNLDSCLFITYQQMTSLRDNLIIDATLQTSALALRTLMLPANLSQASGWIDTLDKDLGTGATMLLAR